MARIPGQGMNWIRLSTRLAIYHRDGFACVYCATGAEAHGLTLDHYRADRGACDPSDLLTACGPCNSAKQARSPRAWLAYLRAKGVATEGLSARLRARLARPINRAEGRRLASLRRSA